MALSVFGKRRAPYFAFVAVFAFGGFGMGISSISSTNWVEYEVGGIELSEGLFQGKFRENMTKFDVERMSFIDATAGLYITSLIFGFVTAMQAVQGSRLFSKTFYTVGLLCVAFSTTLDLVGASVYQSNLDSGYSGTGAPFGSNSSIRPGYGLIAAWVVFGCHFVATCALGILYMQLDDWR